MFPRAEEHFYENPQLADNSLAIETVSSHKICAKENEIFPISNVTVLKSSMNISGHNIKVIQYESYR